MSQAAKVPGRTGAGLLGAFGGLCGAAGVALSAYAAHAGGTNVATAATMLLMHAPLFIVLGLVGRDRALLAGGWVVLLGLALFSGDLLLRHYAETRLFPMAAPTGGVAMIAGWLGIAAAMLLAKPPRD